MEVTAGCLQDDGEAAGEIGGQLGGNGTCLEGHIFPGGAGKLSLCKFPAISGNDSIADGVVGICPVIEEPDLSVKSLACFVEQLFVFQTGQHIVVGIPDSVVGQLPAAVVFQNIGTLDIGPGFVKLPGHLTYVLPLPAAVGFQGVAQTLRLDELVDLDVILKGNVLQIAEHDPLPEIVGIPAAAVMGPGPVFPDGVKFPVLFLENTLDLLHTRNAAAAEFAVDDGIGTVIEFIMPVGAQISPGTVDIVVISGVAYLQQGVGAAGGGGEHLDIRRESVDDALEHSQGGIGKGGGVSLVVFPVHVAPVGQLVAAVHEGQAHMVPALFDIVHRGGVEEFQKLRIPGGNIVTAGGGHGELLQDHQTVFVSGAVVGFALDVTAAPDSKEVHIGPGHIFQPTVDLVLVHTVDAVQGDHVGALHIDALAVDDHVVFQRVLPAFGVDEFQGTESHVVGHGIVGGTVNTERDGHGGQGLLAVAVGPPELGGLARESDLRFKIVESLFQGHMLFHMDRYRAPGGI